MSIFLETKRLIIKTPVLSDFDDLYKLQSDPDVMKYIGTGIRNKDEVLDLLRKAIVHQEKHGFSLGNVFNKSTGEFVGRAGLIYLGYDDTQPNIEVGAAFLKSCWKLGYGTELGEALIQWGFNNLKIDKLVAVAQPANEGSRRTIEKLGMSYVGRILYYNKIEVVLYELYKNTWEIKITSNKN